jgi:hypothetical protein
VTEKERRLKLQKEAIEKIKYLFSVRCGQQFVKEELPRVSKGTLEALIRKGILKTVESPFKELGDIYYLWEGKELE